MQITEVREASHYIASPMRNAVIDFSQMTVSLVALITDVRVHGKRVVGFGFNSNGRYAQSGLLRERFFPRLLAAAPDSLSDAAGELDPWRIHQALLENEKPGGHGERSVAVGIIDMAVWDALAKAHDIPVAVYLAERFGRERPLDSVSVYAAGGYYHPDGDLTSLRREIRSYLDLGYTRVKMKIGGAPLDEDLRRIEAVIQEVGEPGRVAVDANGRFSAAEAIRYGEALAPLDLAWYEEPVDPLDYASLSDVAASYPGPLATGENIFSTPDALNLARYGGLRVSTDILQMDPALSYGVVEYARMLDALRACGWSESDQIPHGGHQLNLALGAAFRLGGIESYPGVFEPFGGFADDQAVEDGFVGWPEVPGVGLEAKAGLRPLLAELWSE